MEMEIDINIFISKYCRLNACISTKKNKIKSKAILHNNSYKTVDSAADNVTLLYDYRRTERE